MEIIVKQAREVGTSAGVLLPRKWLNKNVVVTLLRPSEESIAKDATDIILEQKLNKETKGIYLYGSYARGDYEADSDIDILVITKTLNKLIKKNNYEILFVSEDNFSKNLPKNLNYLSLLEEKKVIFNEELIEKYLTKKIKPNLKEMLYEISRILRINESSIKDCVKSNMLIPDGIVYSVVLRLREIYLIKCLLSKKKYDKIYFIKLCGKNNYEAYIRVKNGLKEIDGNSAEDLINLIELSKKWREELKG